ncbi:MAG: hypothetical protein HN352_08385 [Bacteroidetes bacterium]|jgi:hypothetical protein|nr:hypothetical protein [Bacteroidota bacterium]MBT4401712.1 hypothetical protein [Bacteroidota bacterium]MBT4408215.1 hypothetical protein [Bacteroidota bacterium]MBT5426945.1 hypothetical protein [Bacteroidota bacterium]MBT7094828.1 hypothetical protein [Bacteroidota bacterium]
MNRSKKFILILGVALLSFSAMFAQVTYSPYYKVKEVNGTVDVAMEEVKKQLTEKGFEVLGTYHPEGKSTMGVLVFTRDDLKKAVISNRKRGIHAAVVRVGFISKGGKTTVSFTNPDYFNYAYLQGDAGKSSNLRKINADVKAVFRSMGSLRGFGGRLEAKKLVKYRYMVGMEGFKNPVELQTFSSFKTGVSKIQKDLKQKEGKTQLVYSIVDEKNQVAIFGIGLLNKDKGEPHFLPIIGEDHVAAMPYEIVMIGKEATMLHGRFRIALHWPELTMGTFSKIMSTPGDIKDLLKALTE